MKVKVQVNEREKRARSDERDNGVGGVARDVCVAGDSLVPKWR
jgi:hypothetical protein